MVLVMDLFLYGVYAKFMPRVPRIGSGATANLTAIKMNE